ncbi:MAG: SCP2 sterol-binding domain-containing protein [Candidatus Bathyarchaeota archaeon]|nr:SCP2 sterol-binding domain-containing protein [Candidatus Bathyarchaeota archaeon]
MDEKYLELAKDEYASYTFVIRAEHEKGVEMDLVIGYTVDDGRITDIWLGERKTDFTITGKYEVWINVLLGKLGATKALMMRKLKVKGNLLKLMKYTKPTLRWLEILRSIPTEFHGEYSKYNITGAEG